MAWIIDQLGVPNVVFGLLGIEEMEPNGKGQGGVIKAEREYEIRRGRFDIYITRGGYPTAVVEVKLVTAEEAERGSLRIYRNWAEKRGLSARKQLILLAVDGEKADYDGFRLLRWRDVCLRLRKVSLTLISRSKLNLAAVVLAFVGAVEQNLLKFSYDLVKSTVENMNKSVTLSSDIPDYLAKVAGGEPMASRSDKVRKFVEYGCTSYFEAVRAVEQFEKEILKQSKEALEAKLPELKKGLRLKGLNREGIGNYTFSGEDYADLCARLELDADHWLYTGLEWRRRGDTREVDLWAFTSVWIKEPDKYWDKLPARYRRDLHRDGNDIYFEKRCSPREMGKLQAMLERTIERWCEIWRKTGGIAALGKKG